LPHQIQTHPGDRCSSPKVGTRPVHCGMALTTPASHAYIGSMVARKKPSKPAEHRWQITFIKASPVYLGDVYARDEATAIEEAAREFEIDDTRKTRVVARRADDH